MPNNNSLLQHINTPEDIRKLSLTNQETLCNEIRWEIIQQLSQISGHFSASLGVVELTVAIHAVFNTPNDKLIWDVGHQSYAHKIITGRKNTFHTLRQYKGISGFPRISESPFDDFGTGHSSTSISAILGMAVASQLERKTNRQHIAVIGDGALTAGLAFEALNNASSIQGNVLIIINDNQQSIDDSVGALEQHFKNIENAPQNIFQNLGIDYYGIVNANDYEAIYSSLLQQKRKKGIRVLHCKTVKGFGYKPAETGDASVWHAPGKFEITTGQRHTANSKYPMKYQDVFGKTLVELGKKNKNIIAITPAMISGSSLHWFKEKFPNRFFDVGIAEQHAVTFSAGLAKMGKIPFCVIYSSFLQRAYDQIIHDVALQNLPVVFCIDRAGLVGEDGATHHGIFDIGFLRIIPNLIILSPRDEQTLIDALHWANDFLSSNNTSKHPIAIRYPRGKGILSKLSPPRPLHLGQGELLHKGKHTAIISIGKTATKVTEAIQLLKPHKTNPSHYNLLFIKPLDKKLIKNIASNYKRIIVVEDGIKAGGAGSAILELLSTLNTSISTHIIAIDDTFVEHGTTKELYDECKLSAPHIASVVHQLEKKD